MKTTKQRGMVSPGTGIPSLLLIAVVLCLTAFGVLAFVSARADLKLTEANAETVKTAYAAQRDAQKTLAALDALLQTAQAQASGAEEYRALALAAAASLQPDAALAGDCVCYVFPLRNTTQLRITVRLELPGAAARYTVTNEQITETAASSDEPLHVWPGA